MSIFITSLSPSKSEYDVPVDTNIELTVEGSEDFDITTVKFYINGVEVFPSSYYGSIKSIVNITFYSRRRIKYNTKRYSEDNFRYGQQDIFPSIFQYGKLYVCTIEIESVGGEALSENFSFTTEDGIFFNDNPCKYFYSNQTQAIANYSPAWSAARYNKFSNLQQLINPAGNVLEKIEDALFKQSTNYFAQTADLNELATLYKVELGRDYNFNTIVLDDGSRLQVPPDIVATQGVTRYEPLAEFQNDLNDFYYSKLPDRIDGTKTYISSPVIYGPVAISSLAEEINVTLERPGTICLDISGATQFAKLYDDGVVILQCRIEGESRERKHQTEDLTIVDNDIYYSIKTWSKISTIEFINIPSNFSGSVAVRYFKSANSLLSDSFIHVDVNDESRSAFWQLDSNSYGSVLQQYGITYLEDDQILGSLVAKDVLMEYELLDTNGTSNLSITDIAVTPYSNLIYGIDDTYLYIFDKREDYPEILKNISGNNGSANFVIELSTDNYRREASGKEVSISCVQCSVAKEIVQYRLKILKPDGSVEYLRLDGSTVLSASDATIIPVHGTAQVVTELISYSMTELGDYIFTLETLYRDGTRDVDAKIARVLKKCAIVKYKLDRLLLGNIPEILFVDFDQQLKLYDSSSMLHTIRFAKDNVLIDYTNGTLYFNENYDLVRVN